MVTKKKIVRFVDQNQENLCQNKNPHTSTHL